MTHPFAFPPYAEISQVMGWLQAETGEPLLVDEAELRDIIALMPHPLFIKNAQSHIVMMNQACEALWGVRAAEALGTDGSPHLPPEHVGQLRAHDLRAFASGETCIDEAHVWNVGHNEMRWMLTYKRPTYTVDGEPHRLICSAIDITGRKHKEAELESALQQARHIAGQQWDAVESRQRALALNTQDNLAQNLIALKLDIAMLRARTGEQQPLLHERASQALATLDASIGAVRDIINELHPATLELGLSAAIEWQLQQIERCQGLPYRLLVRDDSAVPDQQQTSALFHLVQTGLGYVGSSARSLEVELDLQAERLAITLQSDRPLGAPSASETQALNAMRERLATLGGTLHITPSSLHIAVPGFF